MREGGSLCRGSNRFSKVHLLSSLSLSLSISLQKLESLLPSRPDEPVISEDMEEVNMIEYEGTRGGEDGHKEVYDESDEEDIAGGHRVGCAHQ